MKPTLITLHAAGHAYTTSSALHFVHVRQAIYNLFFNVTFRVSNRSALLVQGQNYIHFLDVFIWTVGTVCVLYVCMRVVCVLKWVLCARVLQRVRVQVRVDDHCQCQSIKSRARIPRNDKRSTVNTFLLRRQRRIVSVSPIDQIC